MRLQDAEDLIARGHELWKAGKIGEAFACQHASLQIKRRIEQEWDYEIVRLNRNMKQLELNLSRIVLMTEQLKARQPRFKHDCDQCEFQGRLGKRDLYTCPQGGVYTLVARYGDGGPEYTSGPIELFHAMAKHVRINQAIEE